jgi:hypothetical protein
VATRAEIRDAILRVAGNPSVGAIASLADEMADAIAALDEVPVRGKKPEKETRVFGPTETR